MVTRGYSISLLTLLALVRVSFAAFETNGDLDLSFNAGKLTNGQVYAEVLQPDGKLIIGGQFGKANGVARFNIARLNSDGTLDTGFDPGTGTDGLVTQTVLQTDGKVIIVGAFYSVNGVTRNGIARLNANGSLDMGFDPGSLISADGIVSGGVATAPGIVNQMVLQTDGKIVVIGSFVAVASGATTSTPRSCVARFDGAGAFDSSYNPGAGLTSADGNPFGSYAARQSSGKIIIQGNFDHFDGNPVSSMVRLNTNGSYDGTFSIGTGPAPSSVSSNGLFVQSDDKIVVFGQVTGFNGSPCNEMTRLNVDGAVDGGFSTSAFTEFGYLGIIESIAQQPDGKLVVGGIFYSVGATTVGGIARLKTDGSLDATFDPTGSKSAGETTAIVVRSSDSRIFVGGYFSSFGGDDRNNVALLNNDGSINTSFLPPGGATDGSPQVFATLVQPDGKIIIGGLFSSVNGQRIYNLARLLSDGTRDTGFGVTFGTSRSIRAMAFQSTGKIIVAGSFFAVDGVPCGHVARLNTDGTLDATFNPGTGANDIVYALAVDSSDNVYIGGAFQTVNGTTRNNLAKLGPNGALDLTFDPGAGTAGAIPDVRALAPPTASTGLVVGGFFTAYGGATVNRIVRVDASTAARDTTFTTGTGFNSTVRSLNLTSDGKYYVTGSFSSFNGTARSRVARLSTNGTLDTTFAPPAASGTSSSSLIQNSKLIAGGNFGSPGASLLRYTSTGVRETTLSTGIGVAGADLSLQAPAVTALALQADGKMVIGGIFTSYNGATRYGIARLTDNTLRLNAVARLLPGPVYRVSGSGYANSVYNLQVSTTTPAAANFSTLTTVTTDALGNFQYDDNTHSTNSPIFYRLTF